MIIKMLHLGYDAPSNQVCSNHSVILNPDPFFLPSLLFYFYSSTYETLQPSFVPECLSSLIPTFSTTLILPPQMSIVIMMTALEEQLGGTCFVSFVFLGLLYKSLKENVLILYSFYPSPVITDKAETRNI